MNGELGSALQDGWSGPFVLPRPRYEQFDAYREALAAVDDTARREALARFLPEFQTRYDWQLAAPHPGYDARIGVGDDVLRTLQVDGCTLGGIDPGVKARLSALTQPLARTIEAKLDAMEIPTFRRGQLLLDPVEHADVHRTIEEAFAAANVFEVASAYAGDEVKLGQVALQVNTARSTRLQYGAIDDAGYPPIRTNYFHIDSAGWPHLKVLVYLNDVGLDQGPFRYVMGSHRWTGTFELVVRKTNNKLSPPPSMFMALPEPFRMQAEFGRYMDQDGPQAEALFSRERAIYDDQRSDLVMFDYHGVHRGGFVRQGSRYMLQCNFSPSNAAGPAALARAGKHRRPA